jgi:hypothetical protein
MIASLVMLLLPAAVQPSVDPTTEMTRLFEAACLNGQAKLSPGDAAPAGFEALPRDLRYYLGKPSSAQVWRLGGSGSAFLYLLQYSGDPNANPRICGVASDRMSRSAAADAMQLLLTGGPNSKDAPTTEWLSVQNGYRAFAAREGKFKVVQINWLSEAQRQAAAKSFKNLNW